MKLIKVKHGLLEAENFFLASSFSDFAGEANVTRDISTGKIKLISNNKIQRAFNYNEFVIEVEKENFQSMDKDEYSMLYLGNEDYTFGIRDNKKDEENKFWKILKRGDYIQAYSSNDGEDYENIGGMAFENVVTKQGFGKFSLEPLVLNNYKVYSAPYVTIQNFPEGTVCELYDKSENLIKVRLFDEDLECKVFLDYNLEGKFIFKNEEGDVIYESTILSLGYGDVYIFSPYNFEVIYRMNVVTNTNPAILQDLEEVITIRNIGDKAYSNISIGTETPSNDLIELSLDGEDYYDKVALNIDKLESKDIYVKITKNADNNNFNVRDFQLVIGE